MAEELKEEVVLSGRSGSSEGDVSSSGASDSADSSSSGSGSAGSSPASSASSDDSGSEASSPTSPSSPNGMEAGSAGASAAAAKSKSRGLAAGGGGRKLRMPKLPAVKAPQLKKPKLDCITPVRLGKFLLVLGPALVLTGLVMDYMIHKMFPSQIRNVAVVSFRVGVETWF